MMMIEIGRNLQIPESEIQFTVARSGGPGGQHANKTSTQVVLWFDVTNSPSLSESQKDRIRRKLSNRINREGVLQINSQRFRSQAANKADALNRFAELLKKALARPKRRKRTRVPRSEKERRIRAKKRRSEIKNLRRSPQVP